MKLEKDLVWVGGIGLILYLLATKKSDGTAPASPDPSVPDGSGLPTGLPSSPQKKKKTSQAPSKPNSGSGSGEGSVEKNAQKLALERLKQIYDEEDDDAIFAASQARSVYLSNRGAKFSEFDTALDDLSKIDVDFSVNALKLSDVEVYIAQRQLKIDELKDQISDLLPAFEKATAINREIAQEISAIRRDDLRDKDDYMEPEVYFPTEAKLEAINDQLSVLTGEVKKASSLKTKLIAANAIVNKLKKIYSSN